MTDIIKETINAIQKQPRLQEFVICLYNNEPYQLNKLRLMDCDNYKIAMLILKDIYPNFKKDLLSTCEI
ncbi:hypothetical protein [Vibrio harveyi]|uniref:hypothetical protein n=1 Tax=Vibrio harveyi TaxID=669 RepID=UPI00037132F7|nr:hypothetical protein [Vibrio harveyi]